MRSLFTEMIQRDSDVCSNCFRRTHDTFERNYAIDTYRDGNETKLWAREIDAPDRSYRRRDNTTDMPGDEPSEGTYVVCACGVARSTVRPISKETALEYAERLAQRLGERGVEVDTETLVSYVDIEMSKPENQGTQDDVFAGAVAHAAARTFLHAPDGNGAASHRVRDDDSRAPDDNRRRTDD